MRQRIIESAVGGLVVFAIVALFIIGLNLSTTKRYSDSNAFFVSAQFDNVSGLAKRAPVRIAGVTIGSVQEIVLDKNDFSAKVTLAIDDQYRAIPVDTTASVYTEGILGAKYISLEPGFEQNSLKEGAVIYKTHSSVILEHLISRMLFGASDQKAKKKVK
jgi:phospholipid/cholesterol/gamma-HCH transport system substrate-binding protein